MDWMISDWFIGILLAADTHQICFIKPSHSSAFIFLCAITRRIVVLDDKGLAPVFNMMPNTEIEWEKVLFCLRSLTGKCTIGITCAKRVVSYDMCKLPNSQIHSPYLVKRKLQFSVKPGASCPNHGASILCRSHDLSWHQLSTTGTALLWCWELQSVNFSYSCWEIRESYCCVQHMDVIIWLTGILVTKEHSKQSLMRIQKKGI